MKSSFTDRLEKGLETQSFKYLAGKIMFCQRSGKVLDFKTVADVYVVEPDGSKSKHIYVHESTLKNAIEKFKVHKSAIKAKLVMIVETYKNGVQTFKAE